MDRDSSRYKADSKKADHHTHPSRPSTFFNYNSPRSRAFDRSPCVRCPGPRFAASSWIICLLCLPGYVLHSWERQCVPHMLLKQSDGAFATQNFSVVWQRPGLSQCTLQDKSLQCTAHSRHPSSSRIHPHPLPCSHGSCVVERAPRCLHLVWLGMLRES